MSEPNSILGYDSTHRIGRVRVYRLPKETFLEFPKRMTVLGWLAGGFTVSMICFTVLYRHSADFLHRPPIWFTICLVMAWMSVILFAMSGLCYLTSWKESAYLSVSGINIRPASFFGKHECFNWTHILNIYEGTPPHCGVKIDVREHDNIRSVIFLRAGKSYEIQAVCQLLNEWLENVKTPIAVQPLTN